MSTLLPEMMRGSIAPLQHRHSEPKLSDDVLRGFLDVGEPLLSLFETARQQCREELKKGVAAHVFRDMLAVIADTAPVVGRFASQALDRFPESPKTPTMARLTDLMKTMLDEATTLIKRIDTAATQPLSVSEEQLSAWANEWPKGYTRRNPNPHSETP